ncbi:MAG: hypothetical protein AAGB48_02125 [Planctomycetota bacterium]
MLTTLPAFGQTLAFSAALGAALLSPSTWAQATTETAAAGIERSLSAMAEAATAGDGQAYLEHVAIDEPEFRTEQIAWAKDIGRIAPDVLVYELLTEPELAADGTATADLRITWNTPNWEAPDRTIELPARFVPDGGGGWGFGGRAWNELDAEGLRVLYTDGLRSQAEAAVDFWPEVKAHVETGFEMRLDHPQVVKLYADMSELQLSIYPSYAEPLGGWNEPGESIKLVAGDFGPGYLKTVLAHEYGHALSFAMGPPEIAAQVEFAHAVPWWVLEGTAELAAARFSRDWSRTRRMVEHWHANGKLIAFDRITNFYETDPADYRYVYTMGEHMVAYLSERFGRTKRNEWLRAMMNGSTLEEASSDVLGESFQDLDNAWRASITSDVQGQRPGVD